MKKVALVFVVAVLLPSLVLAWLALRSLRDQQFLLERQQSLLDQQITDTLAQDIAGYLAQQQQAFAAQVENLAATGDVPGIAARFDDEIRQHWPLADVGFCVTTAGKLLSPPPNGRPAAQMFRLDNSGFLANREPVEVYLAVNNLNTANASAIANAAPSSSWGYNRSQAAQSGAGYETADASPAPRQEAGAGNPASAPVGAAPTVDAAANNETLGHGQNGFTLNNFDATTSTKAKPVETQAAVPAGRPVRFGQNYNAPTKGAVEGQPYALQNNLRPPQSRKVSPQSQKYQQALKTEVENQEEDNLSKVVSAEAEFRQLIGDQTDGMLARFLQNKLRLMCWHRLSTQPDLVFGAQLNLDRMVENLRGIMPAQPAWADDLCVAILDDNARPMVLSRPHFQAAWKRPFVASEVGDALPHWEVAAYLLNPAQLTQAAQTARLTLGLLVAMLMIAIGVGSLLIVRSLGTELKLARQKTDFVSNVSHELKTPLTSIRMFSELLAEGRVTDPVKQRSYLQIISAETARLTRLINNVLDFSRMERGEKKYHMQPCDLTAITRTVADTLRPHLETAGFQFACELPGEPLPVQGDPDALSQVIVNLLSNAEKYSNGSKEITLRVQARQSPLPHVEIQVLDRGPGVPRGCEEKIFEKFYRAHDSLSSGIQGSGLGLTIARQIARAHGGDVAYEARAGGGSCFSLRLPARPNLKSQISNLK